MNGNIEEKWKFRLKIKRGPGASALGKGFGNLCKTGMEIRNGKIGGKFRGWAENATLENFVRFLLT